MTYLGLRPGEKLYEELLVKTEELDKTDNSMIFIERDTALNKEEIYKKIKVLRDRKLYLQLLLYLCLSILINLEFSIC